MMLKYKGTAKMFSRKPHKFEKFLGNKRKVTKLTHIRPVATQQKHTKKVTP
jgi:hypothetical protein